EMREAMGQAGVRAAEAIGYKGAGTVEFIVDASDGLRPDRFWFMEMNTRLQVEHPVTEAITGVDLVEWQVRVAAGEALPVRQEDLSITGHAFEARLYAEDVPKGFLPATGTLTHLAFPTDARADSGVRAGDTISPWYDPMIAKLTVHGPTREVALSRLGKALAETQVSGTTTNLAFLGALTSHTGFDSGDVDTGLIGRDLDVLAQAPEPDAAAKAAAAMVALDLHRPQAEAGFTLWAPLHRAALLSWLGEPLEADVQVKSSDCQIWTIDGETVRAQKRGDNWYLNGRPMPQVATTRTTVTVFDEYGLSFDRIDPLDRDTSSGGDSNMIVAPMPGLVKAIYTEPGARVAEGDRLAVLEAMKMEHSLLAARAGVVAEVLANAGAQVEAGAGLVRLEEVEQGD
ncbi:MAG: biotin/lipoyl-containing protein, partial [Pseudomonadota bacterium]